MQDAQDLLGQKDVAEKIRQGKQRDDGFTGSDRARSRCCGKCGKAGHNARTCQETTESLDSPISSVIVVDY